MIYGFALGGTGHILYRLKQLSCCYLVFPNNLDHYLNMLLHDQPEYIVGLGSYSGVDQEKIRIETICTNQFRNNLIESDHLITTEIQPFLQPTLGMKYATAIGNSYCNQTSWEIMKLINQKQLKSRYTFLHIPKNFKPWIAAQEIDQALVLIGRGDC